MNACPFSSNVNRIQSRSLHQAKLRTDRSNFSVRSRVFPVFRSCTRSRHLSDSKPARACERQARYFPSGEERGVVSAPGLVEIFFGSEPDWRLFPPGTAESTEIG